LKTIGDAERKLSIDQEKALSKAHTLLGFHARANGHNDVLSREDLKHAVQAVMDEEPTDALLNNIINKFSANKELITLDEFRSLLTCGMLYPENKGRYWVALSLAEAETIRRILHIRKNKFKNQIIPNKDTELALRYSPISAPKAPLAGDGGVVFDCSPGWKGGSKATLYEASTAHNCFRFFDCDMHFPVSGLNILIRVLRGSVRDRERFFTATVGCRRRMERKVVTFFIIVILLLICCFLNFAVARHSFGKSIHGPR
jgi:hypothetical protein